MIEWLGPIVYEYYSATEVYLLRRSTPRSGSRTAARSAGAARRRRTSSTTTAASWRPASRAPSGRRAAPQFEYHNDPEKTAELAQRAAAGRRSATSATSTRTGYLYLTDRKADMIISGGVNIYPQEAENVAHHPPGGRRRRRVRDPARRARRGGQGRSCSSSRRAPAGRARGRAARLLPRAAGEVQVPALDRLHATSCRATRPASSTSACCATSTPGRRTPSA